LPESNSLAGEKTRDKVARRPNPLLYPEKLPGLGEFQALLENRDPAGMASQALSILTTQFGASAGSLFYATRPPLRVRLGILPEALAAHLDQWEANVEQKILAGNWRVAAPEDSLWVSRSVRGIDEILVYSLILDDLVVVGAICVAFPKAQGLTEAQRSVLTGFLRAIGTATNLTSELSLLKERLGQLSLFYQVAQSTASTFDLGQVLNDIMQLATAVLDASAAALMLVDEKSGELVFEYAQGEMGNALRKQRTALDEGIAGWVATHAMPAMVNDARSDPRFSPLVDTRTGFLTHSVLCVPLQLRGRLIGVLEVLNKRSGQGFDSEDLSLMVTTANQAAIAIERAQLYQSLRDERDRIIQAQENVRRQVAQNLHDGTVQYLSTISMGINHLELLLEREPGAARAEVESLRELTREATRQARLALFELRPVILETQGLIPALEAYVQQLKGSEQFGIHFETPSSLPGLNISVATTIFAIVQEAVANAKKHASARDVWLRLSKENGWLQVVVEDNGSGFDLKKVEREYDQRGSIGLLSMRERAELIDGRLKILSNTSSPDRGTQVILRVPVRDAADKTDEIIIR
jgi:signal transduction histidine kinase